MSEALLNKLKSDKKLLMIIFLGFLGVVVLLFFGTTEDSKNMSDADGSDEKYSTNSKVYTSSETEKALAEKVESLVSQLQGVGSVSVAVTVGSSGEYVYAENIKSETDSQYSSVDKEVVLFDDNNESGLLLYIKNPEVIGVAVVCQGAGSAVVKAEVTELVSSLFGIGADKIYVGNKS